MADEGNKNVLAVSLIAGLAGATAGVLFAPRSGKETRAHIKRNAQNVHGKAEKTLIAGKDKAHSLKDRLTSAASETGRKVKQDIEETKEDLTGTTSAIRTSKLDN